MNNSRIEISELVSLSQKITRELRESFFGLSEKREVPFLQPPDIVFDEPLGPWPEIILHSISCVRSSAGKCTPCFYSRVDPVDLPLEPIHESLLAQLEYVFNNFDNLVIQRQTRLANFPITLRNNGKQPAMLALGMTGSIFSDQEIPAKYREEIFRRVVNFANKNKIELQLFIASHVKDVLRLENTGELQNVAEILKPLSIVNLMGFESANDLVREGIYVKGISLCDFEKAVMINRKYGFLSGAYVFLGLHSLTQKEIIFDAQKSFQYLQYLGVLPVVMWPHLQPYTINHLLYQYGRYDIIELRTLNIITKDLVDCFRTPNQLVTDPWLIAMEGGPPEPVGGVYSNPHRLTCDRCAHILRETFIQLRRDYKIDDYLIKIRSLDECDCRFIYDNHVKKQELFEERPLYERALENLEFAKNMKQAYLQEINGLL
jgi:radical SAM enzyme (TIGR01210 family)